MTRKKWANWSGRVVCRPRRFYEPGDIDEVVRLVREAGERGETLRVAGSGHSFTELAATDRTLVSLDRMTDLLEVDTNTRQAVVWAGTKLWRLNELLDPFNLALENLGDINKQSIAGAISTGTHGTGLRFGSLSTQVIGLTLVSGTGEVIHCSAMERPDLLRAAQVSLGALGVIVQIALRLVPSYRLRYERKRGTLREVLERGPDLAARHRHFEYFFFPHTDAVLIKFLDETTEPTTRAGLGRWFTDAVLENWMFRLASARCRAEPQRCPAVNQRIVRRLRESVVVDRGHRVLSTKRKVRFNEMEYAVPVEHGAVCMAELAKWIARDRIGVHFPIEFRYVKGDDVPLSPFYGRDSVAISIHQYVGMEYDGYFRGAEKIFREYGGRPHWGKLHYLNAAELRALYPRWDEFHRVRRQLDPNGVFMTPYLRKLLLDSS